MRGVDRVDPRPRSLHCFDYMPPRWADRACLPIEVPASLRSPFRSWLTLTSPAGDWLRLLGRLGSVERGEQFSRSGMYEASRRCRIQRLVPQLFILCSESAYRR